MRDATGPTPAPPLRRRPARLDVAKRPATNAFSPAGRLTATTHLGDRVVKVFDAAGYREIATVAVGRRPVNSVFSPDGRRLYVTNQGDGTVSIIDTARWAVAKTLKVGKRPFAIYLFDSATGRMTQTR